MSSDGAFLDHDPGDLASARPATGGAPGRGSSTARLPASARAIATELRRLMVAGEPAPLAVDRKAAAGAAVGADAETSHAVAASQHGAPLPAPVRARFEASLGADLGAVRIHHDAAAATAAAAMGARAYAHGDDVFMAAGEYQPHTDEGLGLLAHEVAHTVQQRGGGATRQAKLTVSSPGDAHEVDADRAAAAMIRGDRYALAGTGLGIQRWIDPAMAAWAQAFVAQAPPELIPTLVAQIRAARARPAPAASGVPVPLSLGDDAHGAEGRIRFEDLEDLLHLAQGRQRPANPYASVGPDHRAYPDAPSRRRPAEQAQPTTVDQEPHGPLPAEPTGVEGTADEARLAPFLSTVRADLAAWRTWREQLAGTPPGRASARAAQALQERRYGTPSDIATHVRRALGQDQINLLREMHSVNFQPGSLVLGELFGFVADPYVPSTYRMRIEGSDATVTYSNRFGMRYTHHFRLRQALFGRGAALQHHVVLVGELHDSVFHPPSTFTGPYVVAQIQLGTERGVAMRYLNGPHIPLRVESGDSAGLQLRAGAGWSSDAGNHAGHAGPPEPGRRPDYAPAGDALLYRSDIYFQTGSDRLPAGADPALAEVVARIDGFRVAHPDAPIEIRIAGHASPRWQGHGTDAAAADADNLALAHRRAAAVEQQLTNAVRARTGGSRCDFRVSTCRANPEVLVDRTDRHDEGSATALDAGHTRADDPPEWRRVEILVYGRQYRETQIHNQPDGQVGQPPVDPAP